MPRPDECRRCALYAAHQPVRRWPCGIHVGGNRGLYGLNPFATERYAHRSDESGGLLNPVTVIGIVVAGLGEGVGHLDGQAILAAPQHRGRQAEVVRRADFFADLCAVDADAGICAVIKNSDLHPPFFRLIDENCQI